MKTVLFVVKQTYINMPQVGFENYWGLGDVVRSIYCAHQLSRKLGFKLIVDISLHPISKFLKPREPNGYEGLIDKIKDSIIFLTGDIERQMKSFLEQNDFICLFFNNNVNYYNDHIDNEASSFVREIMTPSAEIEKIIEIEREKIPIKNYSILHYRLGDQYLKLGDNRINEKWLEHFNKNYK